MNYSPNPTITHVPSSTLTAPRGPLALLVKPPPSQHDNKHDGVVVTTQSSSTSKTYHLHYFQCNPISPCLSRVHSSKIQQPSRRRRQRRQGTLQQEEPGQEGQDKEKEQLQSILQGYYQNEKIYHPRKEAFTLLFFCELNCRNSQRFTMVLSSFLKTIQSMENFENDKPPPPPQQPQQQLQLICIPNDDLELSFLLNIADNVHDDVENNPTINHDYEAVSLSQRKEKGGEANILTHLMSCCDFWHMGYDHCNRLSMIRMLSVSVVPTLVVIDNNSGRVITMRGMEAVEYACSSNLDREPEQQQQQQQCKTLLEEWRQGRSGIPWIYTAMNSCVVS